MYGISAQGIDQGLCEPPAGGINYQQMLASSRSTPRGISCNGTGCAHPGDSEGHPAVAGGEKTEGGEMGAEDRVAAG